MGTPTFRVSRAVLGLGLALSLALFVTVLVRGLDAAVDLMRGAWVLFDDSGVGLDGATVPALWDQWFLLWGVAAVYWPIASGILIGALRRTEDDLEPGILGAVVQTCIPLVATFGLYAVADAFAEVARRRLPEGEVLGRRISSLARLVPASFAAGGVVAFLSVFAIALPTTAAQLVMLVAFLLPLGLPPLVRAIQIALMLRLLRDLAERATVDGVRAGHSAPVGA